MIAIAAHTPKMYVSDRPAFFIPTELDSPSGMFERKIAMTATQLTEPPASIVVPITTDSGILIQQRPDSDRHAATRLLLL